MEIQTPESTENSAVLQGRSTEITLEQSAPPVVDHPQTRETTGQSLPQVTNIQTEEVRSVLKVIAATGKFWYDWEKLRSMLSLHLMQVISEYPQTKMTTEEQKISLGETHAELAKRLDDALHSFVDGPPFTLQRLSEIILDARILYPNLSKLALALQKNLSVTSTLTISTDPYPPSLITKATEVPNPNPQLQSDTVMENGWGPVAGAADRDEIMTEVETTDKPSVASSMTTDAVGSSGELVQPTGLSKL